LSRRTSVALDAIGFQPISQRTVGFGRGFLQRSGDGV